MVTENTERSSLDQENPHSEYDLFISYAHDDNIALQDLTRRGWVDEFDYRLQVRLNQLFGKKPSIWRDKYLPGTTLIWDEIYDKLIHSRILVSILTPRYVKSDSCLKEVEYFRKHAGNKLRVGNQLRIISVIKTPPNQAEGLPTQVKDVKGYEFYEKLDDGKVREFTPELGPEYNYKLQFQINDLAQEIVKSFFATQTIQPRKDSTDQGDTPPEAGKVVYVALTSSDLHDKRESICSELKQHGYTILPNNIFGSLVSPDFEISVKEEMKQSTLAIHIFSSVLPASPEGSDKSIARIQYEIANDLAFERQSSLPRMLWIPNDLQEIKSECQKEPGPIRKVVCSGC